MTNFETFFVGRTGLTLEQFLEKHQAKNLVNVTNMLQVYLNAYASQFDNALLYPTADLYDRYTIELLKCERANADNLLHVNILFTEIKRRDPIQHNLLEGLYEVNGQIWDLESDIRKGVELGLEEVGRRAIAIRNLNAKRIMLKNEVATFFHEIKEYKYHHASQVDAPAE